MVVHLSARWGARTLAVAAAMALIPALSPAGTASAAAGCRTTVPGDVNGDGRAEVAVGESGNHVGAGAVHVFYGYSSGLVTKTTGSARNDQYFTQESPGVPGSDDPSDSFGGTVALGDFDDDGCADLAVGAYGDDDRGGSITVLYGSTGGITTTGARKFNSGSLGHAFSRLGTHLVVADLNGDGVDDVAGTAEGKIVVLYGDPAGLGEGEAADIVTSDSPTVPDGVGMIGTGLSAGDFNGNERAELAVGASGTNRRGSLFTLERTGDSFAASASITLASPGIPDSPEDFLDFGAVTAAGDVDADGTDDLALGFRRVACEPPDCDPLEDDDPPVNGAVVLLPGSSTGLTTTGAQVWTQDSPGVVGGARGDAWGSSLAMGRLDSGPTDDLAIGAPYDVTDDKVAAGSVTVLLGSADGLTTAGAGGAIFHQGISGIAGSSERFDQFGQTLTTAYVQNSGQASLVIGSFEGVGKYTSAGQICQLASSSSGPQAKNSRTLNADSSGVSGQPGYFNFFGVGLG